MEVKIVAHGSIGFAPLRQWRPGLGMQIVAQRVPVGLPHFASQAELVRGLAPPAAGEFLPLGIIVGRAVVTLRTPDMTVLTDPQHASLYRSTF